MPKFFVMSDIHGFYDEMITALDEAGFDKNNEDHWIITCGDHFDRGEQPLQVLEFLQSLPRKILVKGNHETLLLELLQRGFPYVYDWQNGTSLTVMNMAPDTGSFGEACTVVYAKVKDFIDGMVNYFETDKYIFVHSWIPLKCNDDLPMHYMRNRKYEFNPNWREAHHSDWENARWGNPYTFIEKGWLPEKTIVFGHWHCSTGWAKAEGRSEFGKDAKFDPFYGDGFISIDACTAHSGKCNVIVIEDEFLKETE